MKMLTFEEAFPMIYPLIDVKGAHPTFIPERIKMLTTMLITFISNLFLLITFKSLTIETDIIVETIHPACYRYSFQLTFSRRPDW
jgi:hypothetical protein